MKLIVANNKGGVGKTTFAWHISIALELIGNSVLCVDTDLNQLDLIKLLMKEEKNKDRDTEKIYKSKFNGVDCMILENIQDLAKQKLDKYDIIVVDTHPNIYSPAVVEKGDFLLVPFEGDTSITNSAELLTDEVKKKTIKILGIINKGTRAATAGIRELRLARKLGVEIYPYVFHFVPSMRRAWLKRCPIWEVDKRSNLGDCFMDIAVLVDSFVKKTEVKIA